MACCGQGGAAQQAARKPKNVAAAVPAATAVPGQKVLVSVRPSVPVPRTLAIPGGKLLVVSPGMDPFCMQEIHANMFTTFVEVTGPCPDQQPAQPA